MKFTAIALLAGSVLAAPAADNLIHTFNKKHLIDEFWAEGANFGDLNKDGENDIIYGPYWWEGPNFEKRHEYAPPTQTYKKKEEGKPDQTAPGFDPLGYSKNFFVFTHDLNKDGWNDIVIIGFPGEDTSWYENPKGKEGHWKRHKVLDVTDNESPTFADITGDGKPEIVCNSNGYFGYATPDWKNPEKPWQFHPISQKGNWQRFTHGLGIGDINGDKRADLLEKDGWWEQPKSLEGDPQWKFHKFKFSEAGSSHMFAYDVDNDGDNDVITALAAHGFGLAWYEQVKENNEITFKQHIIMNKEASDNRYGVKFAQLHAVDLVDMNGDGVKDIVTGKRWWAHGPHGDAEPTASAVVYWFELKRGKDGVDFVPHLIDDDSGIGTQVIAGKVNKDKWPDVVIGNKKGAYILMHEVKKVSKEEYEKAQPKPLK